MILSPSEALALLEKYKYLVIFPVAVFEGPIIIIISGFLVFLNVLNFYVAWVLLVIADTIGDSLYYLIGKYWRVSPRIKRLASFFGYNAASEKYLESHFDRHMIKTFLIAKISHGLGGSVQIASGIANVSYKNFLTYGLMGTIPKTLLLLLVGYYIGGSYVKIDGYLNKGATVVLSLVFLFVVYKILNKRIKKYFMIDKLEANK